MVRRLCLHVLATQQPSRIGAVILCLSTFIESWIPIDCLVTRGCRTWLKLSRRVGVFAGCTQLFRGPHPCCFLWKFLAPRPDLAPLSAVFVSRSVEPPALSRPSTSQHHRCWPLAIGSFLPSLATQHCATESIKNSVESCRNNRMRKTLGNRTRNLARAGNVAPRPCSFLH